MKVTILSIFIFFIITQANASLITYNFSGQLTLISDPDSLLVCDRNFKTDDIFQAIYTIETDTPLASGTIGAGANTESTYTSAITNFQFYVNNTNLIDSYYRFQTLRNINGYINGKPADWIEITTDGGLDNYNNSYGENDHCEYIDSMVTLVDLTGTALDGYNTTFEGNIPLSFDLTDFSFGNVAIFGPG
ncbi:MAG: hypothetical protein L3J57_00515 [Desulfuromusa sp.]|nr:hypothetical protein [Desulfuromusa sp.]